MAKAATVQSRAYKTSDHGFLIINLMGLVVGYPEPKLTLSGDIIDSLISKGHHEMRTDAM